MSAEPEDLNVGWVCPFCDHVHATHPTRVACGWDYKGLYQHYLDEQATRVARETELAALAAARLACQQDERDWNHQWCRCGHARDVHDDGGCKPEEACACRTFERPLRVDLQNRIDAAEAARTALRQQYDELIYAVGNKYPNESRHQTALRYIRQAETHEGSATAKASDLADRLAREEQKKDEKERE